MHGASAESLAAELGLPPGTEVVRSERTGEPLISMSVALQWMQQLVSAAGSAEAFHRHPHESLLERLHKHADTIAIKASDSVLYMLAGT